MRRLSWNVKFALSLSAATLALVGVNYVLFHHVKLVAWGDTFGFYALLDLALVPVQVLVTTLFINQILERRQRAEMMQKLHMVIGAFFSEVGYSLLRGIAALDRGCAVREHFIVKQGWDDARFAQARAAVKRYEYAVHATPDDLRLLRDLLVDKKTFLLGLLQNQSLLEHESFTDMLWAVTHLAEELEYRWDFDNLPKSDRLHLDLDIKRAYGALAVEWLSHMRHLKEQYPYLFSLAVRTNPLDPGATVTVNDDQAPFVEPEQQEEACASR